MNQKYDSLAAELKDGEKQLSLSYRLNQVVNDSTISTTDRNSSLQTIFTISNGMVGSAAIVLPVLYSSYGIMNALIIQFIICMISCKTTTLLLDHNLPNEIDLPDTIMRILGLRWKQLFNVVSVCFLFACSLINIILITQLIYPIIQTLADQLNIKSESQTTFSLDSLSYQVSGLVYMICIFPFFLLKRIGPLLKLLSYGAVSICTCILFITFKGIVNLAQAQQQVESNLKYTSNQYATLAGVFSLAFLGQSMIIPISKNNRKQTNNKRDTQIGFLSQQLLNLAYIWTFLVYALIGIFGSIALTTQTKRVGTHGTTMLDFYGTDDYMAITIQVLMFLQLSTAFPVLQWITRSRFFGLFQHKPSQAAFIGFSVTFATICLAVQMMNTNLSMVISCSGAFVGFFMEYFIPIALHIKCQYNLFNKNQTQDTLDQSIICKHSKKDISLVKSLTYIALMLVGGFIVVSQILVLIF